MDQFLIKTKICIPLSREEAVPRTQLMERLREGEQRQLSLISAPPGYGKTTLVTGWLKNVAAKKAWFTIDKGDDEPVRFFSYLIGTLQTLEEGLGVATKSLLESPVLPSIEMLSGTLINEILSINYRIFLILDDFYHIHNHTILEAVQFLLDNQPRNLQLVILTRMDPQLSLGRLRVCGQITELRESELRFSGEEAVAFLNSTMKLKLNTEAIKLLTEKTEGWVAGLLLAALSIRDMEESALSVFIGEFSGTQAYILDYLLEEMLSSLREDMREFLIETSILDSFNASLCTYVTGRKDSTALINTLYKSNIFMTRLDEAGQWFRFHNLFRDILKSELSEEQDKLLHNRALTWFEENGLYEQALIHAAEAKNYDALERMILKMAWSFIERGEVGTLERWMKELPGERIEMNPELTMYKAWELLLMGKGKEATGLIGTIDLVNLTNQKPELKVNLLILQIFKALNFEELALLKLSEEAEKLLEHEDPSTRTAAFYYVAQIRAIQGRLEESIECYYQAYRTAMLIRRYFMAAISAKNLAVTLLLCGRKSEAIEVCQTVRTGFTDVKGKLLPIAGLIYIPMGMAYYLGDELEEAGEYLEKGINLCRDLSLLHFTVQGEMNLAELKSAKGYHKEAVATIRRACKILKDMGMEAGIQMFTGIEVEFRLRMGQLDYALSWAQSMQLSSTHTVTLLDDRVYMTYARILIAAGNYEEAFILLTKLLEAATTGNRVLRRISSYILISVILLKTDQEQEAAKALGEAVSIAAKEGFYRLFLEEDRCIEVLLPSLKPLSPLFVEELMDKYRRVEKVSADIEKADFNQSLQKENTLTELIEPLSAREIEVLRLVATGHSNSEIAKELFISIGTIKWHITNIFLKLGVKNRVQAIHVAEKYLK